MILKELGSKSSFHFNDQQDKQRQAFPNQNLNLFAHNNQKIFEVKNITNNIFRKYSSDQNKKIQTYIVYPQILDETLNEFTKQMVPQLSQRPNSDNQRQIKKRKKNLQNFNQNNSNGFITKQSKEKEENYLQNSSQGFKNDKNNNKQKRNYIMLAPSKQELISRYNFKPNCSSPMGINNNNYVERQRTFYYNKSQEKQQFSTSRGRFYEQKASLVDINQQYLYQKQEKDKEFPQIIKNNKYNNKGEDMNEQLLQNSLKFKKYMNLKRKYQFSEFKIENQSSQDSQTERKTQQRSLFPDKKTNSKEFTEKKTQFVKNNNDNKNEKNNNLKNQQELQERLSTNSVGYKYVSKSKEENNYNAKINQQKQFSNTSDFKEIHSQNKNSPLKKQFSNKSDSSQEKVQNKKISNRMKKIVEDQSKLLLKSQTKSPQTKSRDNSINKNIKPNENNNNNLKNIKENENKNNKNIVEDQPELLLKSQTKSPQKKSSENSINKNISPNENNNNNNLKNIKENQNKNNKNIVEDQPELKLKSQTKSPQKSRENNINKNINPNENNNNNLKNSKENENKNNKNNNNIKKNDNNNINNQTQKEQFEKQNANANDTNKQLANFRNPSIDIDKKLMEKFDEFTEDNMNIQIPQKIILQDIIIDFDEFTLTFQNDKEDITKIESVLQLKKQLQQNNKNSLSNLQNINNKQQGESSTKIEKQKIIINKKKKSDIGSESQSNKSFSESSDESESEEKIIETNNNNDFQKARFQEDFISTLSFQFLNHQIFNTKDYSYGFDNLQLFIKNNEQAQEDFQEENTQQTMVEFKISQNTQKQNDKLLQMIKFEQNSLQKSRAFQLEMFDLHLMEYFKRKSPEKKGIPGIDNDDNIRHYISEEGTLMTLKNNYTTLEQIIKLKKQRFNENQLIILIKQIFSCYYSLLQQDFFFNNFSVQNIVFCHKEQLIKLVGFSKIMKIQKDEQSFYKINTKQIDNLYTPNEIIGQIQKKKDFIILNKSYLKAYENYRLGVCLVQVKYLLKDPQEIRDKINEYNNFLTDDRIETTSTIIYNLIQNNPVSRANFNYQQALTFIENQTLKFHQENYLLNVRKIQKHSIINCNKKIKSNNNGLGNTINNNQYKSSNSDSREIILSKENINQTQNQEKNEKEEIENQLSFNNVNLISIDSGQINKPLFQDKKNENFDKMYNDLQIYFRFKKYNNSLNNSEQLIKMYTEGLEQKDQNPFLEKIQQKLPQLTWVQFISQIQTKKFEKSLENLNQNINQWNIQYQIKAYYNVSIIQFYNQTDNQQFIQKASVLIAQELNKKPQISFQEYNQLVSMMNQISLFKILKLIKDEQFFEIEKQYHSLLDQLGDYYLQNQKWLAPIKAKIFLHMALCCTKLMKDTDNNANDKFNKEILNKITKYLKESNSNNKVNNSSMDSLTIQISMNLSKTFFYQKLISESQQILKSLKTYFDGMSEEINSLQQFCETLEFFLCFAEINFLLKNTAVSKEYSKKCLKLIDDEAFFTQLLVSFQRDTKKCFTDIFCKKLTEKYTQKFYLFEYKLAILLAEQELNQNSFQLLSQLQKDQQCPQFIKVNNNLETKLSRLQTLLIDEK